MSSFQLITSYLVIPVLYIMVLWFDAQLVRALRGPLGRLRMILAVVVGILGALLAIYFDQTTDFLHSVLGPAPTTISISVAAPPTLIAVVLAFLLLWLFDLAFRTDRAHAILVSSTLFCMLVSGYCLLTFADYKALVSLIALAFLLGVGLYLLVRTESLERLFLGARFRQTSDSAADQRPKW